MKLFSLRNTTCACTLKLQAGEKITSIHYCNLTVVLAFRT